MKVLVTGFGSFPGVDVNPTESLALAADGARGPGFEIIGRVLPVSYVRGPALAIEHARALGVGLVVGLGVATHRTVVCVERRATRVAVGRHDNDGSDVPGLDGPDEVNASVDVDRLAADLGASLSDDAGGYVCNAWLYQVTRALDIPVGFVHVPQEGLSLARLLNGIAGLVR